MKRHFPIIVLLALALSACQQQTTKPTESSIQGAQSSPADVYIALGVEYMNRGMNEVALENLQKALLIDNSSSNAHNVIAVLYDRLNDKSLAGRHYAKSVALSPLNSGAQNNYARFLCAQGEYEKADKHFNLAIKNPLYKSPEIALTNAGTCAMKDGKLERAEHYYRDVLQRNKRFSPALYQMAKLKFAQKNYLSVRAYLQRYRDVSKHTPATLWLGIQAEEQLNNKDAVASYTLQLRQMFPDSHEVGLLDRQSAQKTE